MNLKKNMKGMSTTLENTPATEPASFCLAATDPDYGCEHLREMWSKSEATAEIFLNQFLETQSRTVVKDQYLKSKTSPSRLSPLSLRPEYMCVQCAETGTLPGRKKHAKEKQHCFSIESRTGFLYCEFCQDFIYDPLLERARLGGDDCSTFRTRKRKVDDLNSNIAYLQANSSTRRCGQPVSRGLYNLGQTCYMNVILQTLVHNSFLSTYFLGNGHESHDCEIPHCSGCSMTEIFSEANSTDKSEGFSAVNMLISTWLSTPELAGYHQQDAHEYFQRLVDELHRGTKESKEAHGKRCRCFFHRAFYGKLRSTVTCDNCGNVTKAEDPIVDLSLEMQAKKKPVGGSISTPTLKSCLERFTSAEKLTTNQYICGECGGTPQRATKQLSIRKLPVILCMQLKRFEHTSAQGEKLEGNVEFPLQIDMQPFTTKPKSSSTDHYMYDLESIIVHKGKLDSGHYYAYCRRGDQWFLFNDDQVTVATVAEVLGADAYLLFYTLRSLRRAKRP